MICHKSQTKDFIIEITDQLSDITRHQWNDAFPTGDMYLSYDYLEALEKGLKNDIDFRYIQFKHPETLELLGRAYVQLLRFTPNELNVDALHNQFGNAIPDKFIKNLDARVLLCGNAFATGEHGFEFSSKISDSQSINTLIDTLKQIKKDEKKAHDEVSLILLKDFWPESDWYLNLLKDKQYGPFEIDVNMVVRIQPHWSELGDYLSDLTTKFRTKVKSILHRSEDLKMIDADTEYIDTHIERLEELFYNVMERADYRFAALNGGTLLVLKKSMNEQFKLFSYELDGEIVGFGTAFVNDGHLDANFVGLDYAVNRQLSVYQRILVDFIHFGIEHNLYSVRYGRTAEEIKSTLGAEPVHMKLYGKHRNSITNQLIKPILNHVRAREFKMRKPYKSAYYGK